MFCPRLSRRFISIGAVALILTGLLLTRSNEIRARQQRGYFNMTCSNRSADRLTMRDFAAAVRESPLNQREATALDSLGVADKIIQAKRRIEIFISSTWELSDRIFTTLSTHCSGAMSNGDLAIHTPTVNHYKSRASPETLESVVELFVHDLRRTMQEHRDLVISLTRLADHVLFTYSLLAPNLKYTAKKGPHPTLGTIRDLSCTYLDIKVCVEELRQTLHDAGVSLREEFETIFMAYHQGSASVLEPGLHAAARVRSLTIEASEALSSIECVNAVLELVSSG